MINSPDTVSNSLSKTLFFFFFLQTVTKPPETESQPVDTGQVDAAVLPTTPTMNDSLARVDFVRFLMLACSCTTETVFVISGGWNHRMAGIH